MEAQAEDVITAFRRQNSEAEVVKELQEIHRQARFVIEHMTDVPEAEVEIRRAALQGDFVAQTPENSHMTPGHQGRAFLEDGRPNPDYAVKNHIKQVEERYRELKEDYDKTPPRSRRADQVYNLDFAEREHKRAIDQARRWGSEMEKLDGGKNPKKWSAQAFDKWLDDYRKYSAPLREQKIAQTRLQEANKALNKFEAGKDLSPDTLRQALGGIPDAHHLSAEQRNLVTKIMDKLKGNARLAEIAGAQRDRVTQPRIVQEADVNKAELGKQKINASCVEGKL